MSKPPWEPPRLRTGHLVLAIAGSQLHPITLILMLAIVSVGQVILDLLIKPRP